MHVLAGSTQVDQDVSLSLSLSLTQVDQDVSLSALECVRQNHGHCLEGAILGAYILGMHGYGTLLMDLRCLCVSFASIAGLFCFRSRSGFTLDDLVRIRISSGLL